jgi:hypothetical protein
MVPNVDRGKGAVLSQPTWLKPHLQKACKVMVARVAAASKYKKNKKHKKPEKPILGDPKSP